MSAVIEVKNLTKIFTSGHARKALTDVSFELNQGEVICLVGPSGSGKSTLLRCLAGLEDIQKGDISISGDVSFVFQDYNLWPHKTVLENIVLAPIKRGLQSKTQAVELASKLLKRFGLYDKKDAYPGFLSGGQQQRVAIIRAMALQPRILLLDEITSALDPELIAGVLSVIKILAKEGQSMILATHHLKFALEIADRIIFLENGKLLQETPARDFIYSQKNKRINEFLQTLSLNKEEINVYEGYEEFQAFQLGTLNRFKKGSSKCVVGSSGDRWFESMGDYYEQYERERVERGIAWRMITYKESKLDRDLRLRHPKYNIYRLLPKDIENPANYYVIENVVVIQIFGKKNEVPSIIEIKNDNVAKSYQNYFDLLWEKSLPIK